MGWFNHQQLAIFHRFLFRLWQPIGPMAPEKSQRFLFETIRLNVGVQVEQVLLKQLCQGILTLTQLINTTGTHTFRTPNLRTVMLNGLTCFFPIESQDTGVFCCSVGFPRIFMSHAGRSHHSRLESRQVGFENRKLTKPMTSPDD